MQRLRDGKEDRIEIGQHGYSRMSTDEAVEVGWIMQDL